LLKINSFLSPLAFVLGWPKLQQLDVAIGFCGLRHVVIHPNHHHKEIVMAALRIPKCPSCNTSDFVVLDNTGEKVGTTVGVGAGAFGGYTGATGGAAAGAAIGSIVPGIGTAAGAVVGGILGALGGGAAGGAVGNKVGEQIDKARKQFKCNKCGRAIAG